MQSDAQQSFQVCSAPPTAQAGGLGLQGLLGGWTTLYPYVCVTLETVKVSVELSPSVS